MCFAASCLYGCVPLVVRDNSIIAEFMDSEGYEGAYLLKLVRDKDQNTFSVNFIHTESNKTILTNVAAYYDLSPSDAIYMCCEDGKKYVFVLEKENSHLEEYTKENKEMYREIFEEEKWCFTDVLYQYSNSWENEHEYKYVELDSKVPCVTLLYNDILDCFYLEWWDKAENEYILKDNDVRNFAITEDKIYLNLYQDMYGDYHYFAYDRGTMEDTVEDDYELFKNGKIKFEDARKYWEKAINKKSTLNR